MAAYEEPEDNHEIIDLKNALRTAKLELNLAQSKQAVEAIVKDEEIRKLRLSQCLLQDQMDELHEQLEDEQARCDGLEEQLDQALVSLDQYRADAESAQKQIRTQSREIANLKAELKAMENVTSDSDKILADKLALTREMSSLRPEVEHLRAQVQANTGLLAEKLSLERQLTSLQVELENEKRASARAIAKQGKKLEQDEELRAELEEVRKELTNEKKDRVKAETAVAKMEKRIEEVQAELEAQQRATERMQTKLDKAGKKEAAQASKWEETQENALEELRQELEQEKAARKKAEKAVKAGGDSESALEELREELAQEKRERTKVEKALRKAGKQADQQNDEQAEQLRNELDQEKRERKMAEKENHKVVTEMADRISVLDDMLNAFRDKLRSTKEKLKEKEAELERVKSAAPTVRPSIETAVPVKNARKRMAAIDPDSTNLGTPGGGFPAKRSRIAKRSVSVAPAGDTTFSLTPLLNRAGSRAPSVIPEGNEEEPEQDAEESEAEDTFIDLNSQKASKKPAPSKTKPLAPSASNKANAKPRKKATSALASVAEAPEPSQEKTSENAILTIPLKDTDDAPTDKTKLVPKNKPRKSLMQYSTFMDEPAPEKKKKRKLGTAGTSAMPKTLFDDEEEELPAKPVIPKGIFAARALGKLTKRPVMPISGGHNMLSEGNFQFSPLKRDRKNMSMLK